MGRTEDIQRRIREGAIEEFLKRGIEAATMDGIATKANVTRRTLYKYFPNKELIYDFIIEGLLDTISKEMSIHYNPEKTLEEQIIDYARKKTRFLLNQDTIKVTKLVLSEILKDRPIKPEHLLRMNEFDSQFIECLEEARKEGLLKTELTSEQVAGQFHSILKGQVHMPVLYGMAKASDIDEELAIKLSVDFFIKNFT